MKPQYNRPVEILDHTKYIHAILGKWIEQLQEYIFDSKDYISQEAYLYFFDDVQEYYKYYNMTTHFWNDYKISKRETIKDIIIAVNNSQLNLKGYLLKYNKSYEYILDQLELIKDIIHLSKEHHRFPELAYSGYKQINPRHKSRLYDLVYFSRGSRKIDPEDTRL
tara:strand:+ start:322 stop:816 length:495 start_codon:yes stop_codon:yes gene_type:complete